ncbi:sigma-70 family RNA polymerase sigma factor [Bernardetia sp. Wsw4-3y2]|uniref:RNA polymerase sigma factor n=1 Tax=Bernardetia sp. Wsw4-3y2 TaxID=3127471 RepID=UPI0030CD4242
MFTKKNTKEPPSKEINTEVSKDFLQVLESNKGIIYKIANSYCKESEDQQDLVQEISYQLWKSFEKYDKTYQLSTWIYRISLNVAISFYRKTTKRSKHESKLGTNELLYFEQENIVDEKLQLLNSFIYELKEVDKAIILLYLEDKSQNEIAQIMGLSLSNISTKIHRIKKILSEKFQKLNY